MSIQVSNPFESYLAEEELPRTGDARKFVLHLLYQIEGTDKTGRISWEWKYSGTQEAADKAAGVDGLRKRREREIKTFRKHVERELKGPGQRLFEVEGNLMLTRGNIGKAPTT